MKKTSERKFSFMTLWNWIKIQAPNTRLFVYFIFLFILLLPLLIIVPPMQSPDECAHLTRAYTLLDGNIFPTKNESGQVGLKLNDSLNNFSSKIDSISAHAKIKYTKEIQSAANSVLMKSDKTFSVENAAIYYFPLIYLPSSLALHSGEFLGLSVMASYMIAKICTLIVSLLIIFYAFTIIRPNQFVLAVLLMPMYLFQISSASLDGIATAIAVLAITLFVKIMRPELFSRYFMVLLSVALFLLTTSRVNLFPMLLFLFIIAYYKKNRFALISAITASLLSFVWNIYIIFSATPIRDSSIGFGTKIIYYLTSPIETTQILLQTVASNVIFYARSFIGILGRLDTKLSIQYYLIAVVLFLLVLFLTYRSSLHISKRLTKYSLFIMAFLSTLLVFLAMLLHWTDSFPAVRIEGVQGRYFLIPVLMFAYALGYGFNREKYKIAYYLTSLSVAVIFVYGYIDMMIAIINRYYASTSSMMSIIFG